jgi:hypothetical protein
MKYYHISTSSDPKIIGVNNGIYQCDLEKDKFAKIHDYLEMESFFSGLTYWERDNHTPPKEFNFEYFRLLKKAKQTDILSFCPHMMGCDFILSRRVMDTFHNLSLNNSYFIPTSVYTYDRKRVEQYLHMMYTTYLGFESIDFDKSIFYSGIETRGKNYVELKDFSAWKEYWREDPNRPLLWTEKVALKSAYAKYDYLKTRLGGPFVSERLLERWTKENISGFMLMPMISLEIV